MAIGSLDRAGRLEQLRGFARCQVRSGYRSAEDVSADVYDAALAEEHDPRRARELAEQLVAEARDGLVTDAARWPANTGFDRLQDALAEMRSCGIVVLEAVDDHWDANQRLEELAAVANQPRGIAYFTHSDVWHAVEHSMLEINVWHGTSANVRPGDQLLDDVLQILIGNGIPAVFDEGRIEATLDWQRRPDWEPAPDLQGDPGHEPTP